MDNNIVLKCSNLSKAYKKHLALDSINLELKRGGIYGLIGRNGAGKTTLLKIMDKQLFPTKGHIEQDGNTCLSKDYQAYFKNYSVNYVLSLARHLHPNWNKDLEIKLLKIFDLNPKKSYAKISRGNQNLVSIIITLCSNEEILLFDEPYTGLDPVNREIIYKELIRQNIEEDKTIVLSSHLVSELESMINHVILINGNKIVIDSELDDLKARSYQITGPLEILTPLLPHFNVIKTKQLNNRLIVHIFDDLDEKDLDIITEHGCKLESLNLHQLTVSLTTGKEESLC